MPCYCSSHNCRGQLRTRKTFYKHKRESSADKIDIPIPVKRLSASRLLLFDEKKYTTHITATSFIDSSASPPLSKLEFIFRNMELWSEAPSVSRRFQSDLTRCNVNMLLPPESNVPMTHEQMCSAIAEFLVPLETVHVSTSFILEIFD